MTSYNGLRIVDNIQSTCRQDIQVCKSRNISIVPPPGAIAMQRKVRSWLQLYVGFVCIHSSISGLGEQSSLQALIGPGLPAPDDGHKYIILAIHRLGLANRLRELSSGIILAQATHRRVLVDWQPDPACNASFLDLFHPPPASLFDVFKGDTGVVARLLSETPGVRVATARLPNSSQSDVLILRPDSVVYSPQEAVARAGLAHYVSTTEGKTSGTVEEAALRSPVWLLVGANFMPSHLTCQDYYARKRSIFQSLRPVEAVQRYVTALLDHPPLPPTQLRPEAKGAATGTQAYGTEGPATWGPHVSSLRVGVHVRSHDRRHDWPVVAPQDYHDDQHAAKTFDQVSSPALFVSTLEPLIAAQPGATFMIFSNSRQVKQEVEEEVRRRGGVVSRGPQDQQGTGWDEEGRFAWREDVEGVRRALAELLALSRADLILHSFGSSFGEEAAAWNMAPSVRVREGGSISGVDLSRPFCQNLLFFNAHRDDVSAAGHGGEGGGERGEGRNCYVQGGRNVCTLPVQLAPCDGWAQAWGLQDVYCLAW